MSEPELAPRGTFGGVVAVWVVSAVAALVLGFAVPGDQRMLWLTVALGGAILLSFVVQLWIGRTTGFIDRVAASAAGSLLAMGLVSAGFGLAALIPA